MRLLLLLFCVLFSTLVAAQTPADDTPAKAFEMTKTTVEFLATDKKTYGYQAKETCDGCVSYEQLASFIQTNKLTKADELVRDAKKKTEDLLAERKPGNVVLAELKNFLVDRVTEGEDRKHRFSLKSFPAFENKLSELAGVPPATIIAQEPVSDQQNREAAPDTSVSNEEAAINGVASQSPTKDSNLFSMSGLALLLSILSLGGVIFLYMRKPKTQESATLETKLAQLSDKVFHLEADRKDLVRAVQTLNSKVQQLEGLIRSTAAAQRPTAPPPIDPLRSVLEQPAPQNVSKAQTPSPASPPPTSQSRPAPAANTAGQNAPRNPNPAPSAPSPQRSERFARTADLGDGFSIGGLLSTAERGTIYQLTLEGNQATYRVVDNYEAQQLALSDPYSYLSDACEYQNQPRPGARIQTDQPGRLTLQGEKWKIEQKAKISFV